jgi:hypothetical protein
LGNYGELEATIKVSGPYGSDERTLPWARPELIPLAYTITNKIVKVPAFSYCGQTAEATSVARAETRWLINSISGGQGALGFNNWGPAIDNDHDIRSQPSCPPPPEDPPPDLVCEPGGGGGINSVMSLDNCGHCDWVEWGLYVWDYAWGRWVLVDSWWEWECDESGGGGGQGPLSVAGGGPDAASPTSASAGGQGSSRQATLALVPDALFPVDDVKWIARRSATGTWLVLLRESAAADQTISAAIEGVRTYVAKHGHEPPARDAMSIRRTSKPSAPVLASVASIRDQLHAAVPKEVPGIGRVRSVMFSIELPGSTR